MRETEDLVQTLGARHVGAFCAAAAHVVSICRQDAGIRDLLFVAGAAEALVAGLRRFVTSEIAQACPVILLPARCSYHVVWLFEFDCVPLSSPLVA